MGRSRWARLLLATAIVPGTLCLGGATGIIQDSCGPFTDVTPGFCPFVLELYYLGITAGTSATTFSPDDPLTRGQGAVFISKGLNQSIRRSSRRAALGQWWTTKEAAAAQTIRLGSAANQVRSDGADLWVADSVDNTVFRVRASDGRLLETWTAADGAFGVLCAMGRVFVTGTSGQGRLYSIDPTQPAGDVTTLANIDALSNQGWGGDITFDGVHVWTANGDAASISMITPDAALPWPVVTISIPNSSPQGILFDGSNLWVADGAQSVLRMDSSGTILQSVPVAGGPRAMAFDGANLWVANLDYTLTVLQASSGTVLATLSGNGLQFPFSVAFDGERIAVTNLTGAALSLWRASDLTPLGVVGLGFGPLAVCSDGVNFWMTFGPGSLARI